MSLNLKEPHLELKEFSRSRGFKILGVTMSCTVHNSNIT